MESAKIPRKADNSELFAMVLRGSEQVKTEETPERKAICLDLENSSFIRERLKLELSTTTQERSCAT